MRYSKDQLVKLRSRKIDFQTKKANHIQRLKNDFPIEVKIEGDFYVIESGMNE